MKYRLMLRKLKIFLSSQTFWKKKGYLKSKVQIQNPWGIVRFRPVFFQENLEENLPKLQGESKDNNWKTNWRETKIEIIFVSNSFKSLIKSPLWLVGFLTNIPS